MTTRAVLTLICLISFAMGVHAEDTPAAGKLDPRMRYLAYNPNQVVRMSTAVGATLVVTFGAGETVTAVAVSNSKDLAALPRGNYLFFKASQALSPQPVIVLTASEAGTRRYVFNISTRVMSRLDKEQPDLYYSVQFVYPNDDAAARRKEIEKQSIFDGMRAKARSQQRAQDLLDQPAAAANPDANNFHYVAQGDHSLTPLEVFDNGVTTVFRFPGNVRIPSIYMINPDGKEAAANISIKGDYIEVSAVAREWRLRDGHTVLGIFNSAYDPIGRNPGTGTVRADVWRVVKGTSR
ncbi:P-type conjugative transfer protein VirB9 [Rhizobium leguminosarum]|uniref:P-type conjugative transfer protein VirB9 n=1 Tax=Rhizobium leguminosarum TaxID=384 RepID=UPI001C9614FA|nr:P-type conjugative transfer protein VirB9 [Rhizobium leguminosarum]MBY5336957.1 P-type conjugative transfer protein VirB9 [Rhizobium leguminosarum]MBY5413385.1 P-type conjugative transfer protein VirB9 [Rhizobium leguminosarum]MBY5571606.1 P-type conjugative transfer protein VirB9 [Rhizobium leguminosarum]MBY5578848.1 P-type conjugative transfer protein VirB9 [Rhizobium leguminosarum]MBY5591840.1 P-type conjugative transfer protein VirB9 [Rhizobium leguminosarum]